MSGFFNLQRIITRSNCNRSYSLSNSTPDCTRASKRGVTTSFDTPVGDRARRYPKFPYLSMQVEYMRVMDHPIWLESNELMSTPN